MSPSAETPPASSEFRNDHIQAGRNGEAVALTFLLERGYLLRDRNFRFGRHGELDLVMLAPEGDLVFIEVKSSRQDRAGDPTGWVNGRKQHKIQRIAQAWCLQHGIGDRPMRFDVVGVELDAPGGPAVKHVKNAFLPDGKGYWRG